jgi:protein-L-isoaspartate(D-aspartate) O-methyltransferase
MMNLADMDGDTPPDGSRPAGSANPVDVPRNQRRMVENQMRRRDITDETVLAAMEAVPRREFVLPDLADQAHEDYPLPIGYGQTISQPYIVALMTQLLRLHRGDRVLEVGTGSGYQAAILSLLTDEVYTVEIVAPLAEEARARLWSLGYPHICVKAGDGYDGWPEHAPYDAIVVTAAPPEIPQPLIDQLADGGRLVIPVGLPGANQTLWKLEKHGQSVASTNVTGVLFVPFTRQNSSRETKHEANLEGDHN